MVDVIHPAGEGLYDPHAFGDFGQIEANYELSVSRPGFNTGDLGFVIDARISPVDTTPPIAETADELEDLFNLELDPDQMADVLAADTASVRAGQRVATGRVENGVLAADTLQSASQTYMRTYKEEQARLRATAAQQDRQNRQVAQTMNEKDDEEKDDTPELLLV